MNELSCWKFATIWGKISLISIERVHIIECEGVLEGKSWLV